jgi:NADH-quinone oxidoreductase subunit J
MELIIFLIIAIISAVSAFLVVTQRNVIYSALFLILTLCGLAILYVLLNAPFLAAIQIIVYAGAVMVLFLFVIMLLNLKKDEFGKDRKRIQKSLGILFAILLLVEIAISIKLGIWRDFLGSAAPALEKGFGGPHLLGELLFTKYLLPFELTSVLLLIAIIGAIVLAKKKV